MLMRGYGGIRRGIVAGLVASALLAGTGPTALAGTEVAKRPKPRKVIAAIDQPCAAKQLNKTARDAAGRQLLCTPEWSKRHWRLAPDAVAVKAHAGFTQYLSDLQATVPSSTADLRVIREPGFPDDLANAMLDGIRIASRVYGANENSAFILAQTPEFMYSTARSLAEPCWNTADPQAKGTWLMENALEVRAQQYEGFGHAGLCENVFFAYFNSRKPETLANASPMTATEGVVREYLIQSPSLALTVPQGLRSACWEAESRAWNMTWAIMEQARTPGFTYASRWAHWVSDLALAQGRYSPGLNASEKWISPENGDIRPEMPCQAAPGIGHIQGALAREWLMAQVGPVAYARYPLASKSTGEYRQALANATGVAWDQWIAGADARTASLVAQYPATHRQSFPGLG